MPTHSLALALRRAGSRPARLLATLGVTSLLPVGLGAARKNDRQRDESGNSDDSGKDSNDTADESKDKNEQAKNDKSDSSSDSRRSDKESTDKQQDRDPKDNSKQNGDNGGDESRRQSVRSESDGNGRDERPHRQRDNGDDSGGNNNQSDAEFAQRNNNNNRADDNPTETPTPAPTPSTNPNVTFPGDTVTTDTDDVELTVQSNPDVIAKVSGSGGFAFARSDGVTAISGPDGAQLIQTGPDDSGTVTTPVPAPTQPSDGGNNNVDFNS